MKIHINEIIVTKSIPINPLKLIPLGNEKIVFEGIQKVAPKMEVKPTVIEFKSQATN